MKAFNLNHITIHEQHWDEWQTAISCTQRQHFPLHSGAIYPTDRAGPTVSLETVKGTMLYTMGPFTQQTGLGQRSRLVSNSARAGAFTAAISARLWRHHEKKNQNKPRHFLSSTSRSVPWPEELSIWRRMTRNGMRAALSPDTKPSRARLASVPGRPSVNPLSSAQPRNVCLCKRAI